MKDPQAQQKREANLKRKERHATPERVQESEPFPFALEVATDTGWKRMMIRYSTREIAEGWLPFVMDYWKTSKGRIVDIRDSTSEAPT